MIGDVSNVYTSKDDKVFELGVGTRKLGGSCTCPPRQYKTTLIDNTVAAWLICIVLAIKPITEVLQNIMIDYKDNTCTEKEEKECTERTHV